MIPMSVSGTCLYRSWQYSLHLSATAFASVNNFPFVVDCNCFRLVASGEILNNDICFF